MLENTAKLAKIEAQKAAYRERCRNFDALKEGLMNKYIAEELDLEDRQQESIFHLTDTAAGDYSLSQGYFHACTAFGKTYLMMAMAEGYRDKEPDKKIIILEENAKVLEQVKQDFMDKTSFAAEDIGAFYGKEKSVSAPVIVATYASMEKMVKAVGKENIGLVLCDEAHHILSENRQRVAKEFDRACLYGFTATPDYDEDRDCAKVFGEIIDSVTLREGVEQGLLCSFKNGLFVSNIPVDLSGALNSSGDYDGEKLAEILKQSHLNGIREELANFYLSGEDPDIGAIKGKKMIVNAPNQHEADELAKVFNQTAGYNVARAYHTNTGEQPLAEFNQGRFPVLIQVNRVTEGYSNNKVEICINYPTASKVRSAQRGGRALRRDKENPDKLALIMDIAFKRNNEKSDLEEIRANGQVLSQDIAGDVEMLSPVRLAKIADEREIASKRRQTEKEEKDAIAPDRLFKTVVNVKELYDMRLALLENDEKNTPSRAKLASDLDIYTFQQRWSCRQNGKALKKEDKNGLFKQLQQQQPELFTYVQAGAHQSYVIAKENIPAFKQALAEKGYEVTDPEAKTANVSRAKWTSDLDMHTFQRRWSCRQNGKALEKEDKNDLFKQLQQQHPELFTYVQSGARLFHVIAKENIPDFKQALAEMGYEVTDPEARTANVSRAKWTSDLGMYTFQNRWSCRQNGKALEKEDKNDLFKQLQQQHPELFTCVQAGSKQAHVIAKEKIPDFKQALAEMGYEVMDTEERTAAVSRAKWTSDLDMCTFQKNWSCRQNGAVIGQKNKNDLFKQLQQQHPELFTCVQAGSKQSYVIAKENIPAFKQALQNKGYEVTDPEARTANVSRAKRTSDLDMYTFQNRWSCRQNGKALKKEDKNDLFKQLQQQHPELFTCVQAGSKQAHVIAKEKIPDFKQALAEMGYEALSPRDKLHEAQEKAAAAQTPAEKQKYFAAARKIFRALNPQLEKQNLCAACQQKISAGR